VYRNAPAKKLAAAVVVAVTIAVTTFAVVHGRYVVPSPVVMSRPVATVSVAITSAAMAFAVVQGRLVVTAFVVIVATAVKAKHVARKMKFAVPMVLVHGRVKKKVMKRDAAQKRVHRVQHVLVSSVIVLFTPCGFTQMKRYMSAGMDALVIVMMKIRSLSAIDCIDAKTTFIIFLQSVAPGEKSQDRWTVMAQLLCLGGVPFARRATFSRRVVPIA
jgi:hypothetical protein